MMGTTDALVKKESGRQTFVPESCIADGATMHLRYLGLCTATCLGRTVLFERGDCCPKQHAHIARNRGLAFLMPEFGRPKSLANVGVGMVRRPTQRIVRHAASGSYGSEKLWTFKRRDANAGRVSNPRP